MRTASIFAITATIFLSLLESKAAENPASVPPPNGIKSISVRRCEANPLIKFKSSKSLGKNINGPSVIRVPSWIKEPLGKYYMYFAHHGGQYIRLAYADALEGPWHIHEPGTLTLSQAAGFSGHIASPDVFIDEQKQEIVLYFHGGKPKGGQSTGVALSKDGLTFTALKDTPIGRTYFRVFRWGEYFYATDRGGNLCRSKDGLSRFEVRDTPLIAGKLRHTGVLVLGDQLLCFYSRSGDSPERIVVATATLTDDWTEWTLSDLIEVIQPEKDYEGIEYPDVPSEKGAETEVRQLRDPYAFREDGRTYLFYSVAGEMGIAMAELDIVMKSKAGPER